MKDRGWVILSITFVVAIILFTHLSTVSVRASPFTTVIISLQEDPPCVDVSPGSSGIFTVEGEVACVKWGPDQVKVFLQAQFEYANASVVPSNFVFAGTSGTEETESFTVSTKVPQGTSSLRTATLTVSGYWIQGGLQYEIAPVSIMVIILQYHKIDVFCNNTLLSLISGENHKIEFKVFNLGNGDDIFLLDLKNRDALEVKGFDLSPPMEFVITEKACRDIIFEVYIPENISGIHNLNLCIISKGSEKSDSLCKYEITIILNIESNSDEGEEEEENPFDIITNESSSFPIWLGIPIILIISIIILVKIRPQRVEVTLIQN